MLKEKAGPDYSVEFTTSSRWFRFKNHCSLHNVKLSDESMNVNVKANEEFLENLDKLIL